MKAITSYDFTLVEVNFNLKLILSSSIHLCLSLFLQRNSYSSLSDNCSCEKPQSRFKYCTQATRTFCCVKQSCVRRITSPLFLKLCYFAGSFIRFPSTHEGWLYKSQVLQLHCLINVCKINANK